MSEVCEMYTRQGSQLLRIETCSGHNGGISAVAFSMNADGMLCVDTDAIGEVNLKINNEGYLEVSNG